MNPHRLFNSRSSRVGDKLAFTLIELLTVTAIILILVGLAIGVAGYAQKKTAIQRAKADIAALEMALESYKLDYGTYPTSTVYRVSKYGNVETENSAALYRALAGGSKKYITFRSSQLQKAPITSQLFATCGGVGCTAFVTLPLVDPPTGITNCIILDPWGRPYNYYNTSPLQPTAIPAPGYNPGGVAGGQVNLTTFDLMSYGPDKITYEPNLFEAGPFATPAAAKDDVSNFR